MITMYLKILFLEAFHFLFSKKNICMFLRLTALSCIHLKLESPCIFDADKIASHIEKLLAAMPKRFFLHTPFEYITARDAAKIGIKALEDLRSMRSTDEYVQSSIDSNCFMSAVNYTTKKMAKLTWR